MKPVWIVDDDRSIRWVIEKALQPRRHRLQLVRLRAGRARRARRRCAGSAGVRHPHAGPSGLELLHAVKQRHPGVPVIVMTAYSDLDSAVSAFQGGAFEYLPKPFDIDQAVELIRRALDESLRESEASSRRPRRPRSSARRQRCRKCSAPSAGCHSRT